MTKRFTVLAIAAMLVAFTGCDKMAESSKAVQSVTARAFNDTKSSWTDFFTYHPPLPEPLPQTRYCYQMQSDVVCYDSEQPRLTAKLIGYQDGERISWTQPGGGSLGASGGDPIALRPLPASNVSTSSHAQFVVNNDSSGGQIDTGPVYGGSDTSVVDSAHTNQISTTTLPPVTAKTRPNYRQ